MVPDDLKNSENTSDITTFLLYHARQTALACLEHGIIMAVPRALTSGSLNCVCITLHVVAAVQRCGMTLP